MTSLPPTVDTVRVTGILRNHLRWSAFWDEQYGLWHVAEDDSDSDLYAESSQATTVIAYIQTHSRDW